MTLIPRTFLLYAGTISMLILAPASTHPQTLTSDSTLIFGVVEPLEMTGEPKRFEQPTDIERRIGDINPKNFSDPEELRNAKEAIDQLIQQYPDSPRTSRYAFAVDV